MRNRYKGFNVYIAFVLASSFPLLAQSTRVDGLQQDNFQLRSESAQPLLMAKVAEGPALGSASHESDLPDAPSATKPDASTADPSASPAVKREQSHGAPPAAMGGPLWVDRRVADRNYLLFTGGMFGASVVNAELTLHCLTKHPSCNDVPSSLQSRTAIYGIGIPADFGVAYLTYCLKRKHNHMWYVPAVAVSGANLFFAVRAYRWGGDPSLPVGAAHRSVR